MVDACRQLICMLDFYIYLTIQPMLLVLTHFLVGLRYPPPLIAQVDVRPTACPPGRFRAPVMSWGAFRRMTSLADSG